MVMTIRETKEMMRKMRMMEKAVKMTALPAQTPIQIRTTDQVQTRRGATIQMTNVVRTILKIPRMKMRK